MITIDWDAREEKNREYRTVIAVDNLIDVVPEEFKYCSVYGGGYLEYSGDFVKVVVSCSGDIRVESEGKDYTVSVPWSDCYSRLKVQHEKNILCSLEVDSLGECRDD